MLLGFNWIALRDNYNVAERADFLKLGCGYFYYDECVRVWLLFDPELWGSHSMHPTSNCKYN
jgi:hypothetical protein